MFHQFLDLLDVGTRRVNDINLFLFQLRVDFRRDAVTSDDDSTMYHLLRRIDGLDILASQIGEDDRIVDKITESQDFPGFFLTRSLGDFEGALDAVA